MGFQAELNYVQKGWVENSPTSGTAITTDLTYIELPILTHLAIGRGKTKVVLEGGPYVGYLLSHQADALAALEGTYVLDDSNAVNTAFGMTVGGGITRKIGDNELHLGGRFNIALSNVFDQVSSDIPDYTQSQTIEINLAFLFKVSKTTAVAAPKVPKKKQGTEEGN